MGFNTTVVIMNDALHQIAEDKNFGKNLVNAIMSISITNKPVDVQAGYHTNAATVIEQHHADQIVLVSVGGNYGNVFANGFNHIEHHSKEAKERLLRDVAYDMGFHLRRRTELIKK